MASMTIFDKSSDGLQHLSEVMSVALASGCEAGVATQRWSSILKTVFDDSSSILRTPCGLVFEGRTSLSE